MWLTDRMPQGNFPAKRQGVGSKSDGPDKGGGPHPPSSSFARVTAMLLSPYCTIPLLIFLSSFSEHLTTVAYREVLVDTAKLQPTQQAIITRAVKNMPWNFKIIFAFVSDWFPICGRRRVPYLVIALCMQITAGSLFTQLVLPNPTMAWLIGVEILFMTGQLFLGVTVDTLAVQFTRIESADQFGSMQTNAWIAIYLGSVLGLPTGGLLLQLAHVSKATLWYIGIGLRAASILVSLSIPDRPVPSDRLCELAPARARMLLGELATAMRRRDLWMATLFLWIWYVHPSIGAAADSFLLQQPSASHPNVRGPQPLGLSTLEYSLVAVLSQLGAILGAAAYRYFGLRAVPLRLLFAALVGLSSMLTATTLVLATGLVTQKPWTVVFACCDDYRK